MGCDIHMVLERRIGDGWLGLHSFNGFKPAYARDKLAYAMPLAVGRNYPLFGAVAQVRGYDGLPPRGLPDDPSPLAKLLADEYGADGHSHTWLTLREATEIWHEHANSTPPDADSYAAIYPEGEYFDVSLEETQTTLDDYRLIIWFDN